MQLSARILRCAGAVALAWLCATVARADHGRIRYEGLAHLLNLDRITLVYPAGPGADVERNRTAAERRAAFLKSVHGIEATAVADDQLTAEQRDGNLFVLGWSNRLFTREQVAVPFERSANGFRLFDDVLGGTDEDLMLIHRSPWSRQHYLLFCSRIDPELERYQPLTVLGSDWLILRDLTVLVQGMFDPEPVWPPKRDMYAEADHRAELALLPAGSRSPHYTLHRAPGTLSPADEQAVLAAREGAFAKAAGSFGAPPADFRIELYVYPNKEDVARRTGSTETVHSNPARRELHMVLDAARASSPHEELHLLARAALGPCYLTALYEGLAVVLDPTVGSSELQVYAALLVEHEQIPTLDSLLDEESLRTLTRKGVAFPSAGLLVAWLRGADPAAFARLYGALRLRASDVAVALRREPAAIDAEFRAWIEQQAEAGRPEFNFRQAVASGRKQRKEADYAAAAASFARAAELKPRDPSTLYNLAWAELRAEKYDAAEQHLRRLLELPETEGTKGLIAYANLELARVYDVQGRRELALESYRRVLGLPDWHTSHALAQGGLETAATLESLRGAADAGAPAEPAGSGSAQPGHDPQQQGEDPGGGGQGGGQGQHDRSDQQQHLHSQPLPH
ncbi:MAG TPA: tetratricopeptide repeat protein [Candidatus Polarisedimenticolaceae bacterium]|nr:tetratricopeptide repeat protein [Candidatus Polarisedimenticolaceae bacterium]